MGFKAIDHDFLSGKPLIIRYFPILPNTLQHDGYVELQLYRQRYWPPQRSHTSGSCNS